MLIPSSLKGRPIVTQIAQAGKWYSGEDYHQEYCESHYTACKNQLVKHADLDQWTTTLEVTSALHTDSTGRYIRSEWKEMKHAVILVDSIQPR